jgi:hypothetical protein
MFLTRGRAAGLTMADPGVARLGCQDRCGSHIAGGDVFYWFLKRILIGPILRVVWRPWVEGLDNIP